MTPFPRLLLSLGFGTALALMGPVAHGQIARPPPVTVRTGVDPPLVPAAPGFRPHLPPRMLWMNTAHPPSEASLTGRPVVMLVWNARAVPSLDTLPWFARLVRYFAAAKRGGGDVAFLLVHVPESLNPADSGPVVVAHALDGVRKPALTGVPVLLDDAAGLYAALGSPAIPTLFVFGRDRRLIETVVGRIGRYDTQGRGVGRSIKAALAEPRPGPGDWQR